MSVLRGSHKFYVWDPLKGNYGDHKDIRYSIHAHIIYVSEIRNAVQISLSSDLECETLSRIADGKYTG